MPFNMAMSGDWYSLSSKFIPWFVDLLQSVASERDFQMGSNRIKQRCVL